MSYNAETNPSGFTKLADIKEGDVVTVDAGFSCLNRHHMHNVMSDENGLYLECSDGKHYLDGQADDETGVCVGVWRSDVAMAG